MAARIEDDPVPSGAQEDVPATESPEPVAPQSDGELSPTPVSSDEASSSDGAREASDGPRTMLPDRTGRPPLESVFVRVVSTCGVVGIGVALGAILTSQHVAGWIIGLVVALVSVVISAVLWSSRQL